MKPKLILCFAVVLAGGLAAFHTSASDTNKLRVVVIPSKTDVRIREPFSLALRVENVSETNQTVRVMNCAWEDEWRPSNPNIPWGGGACSKNFPVNVEIPPGGAYTNEATMSVYDPIKDEEFTFRMGFTPIGGKETYWSNEVKLHILPSPPPDTWRCGGKYYRDRNHDGMIDWEASGKTWMGHAVYPYKYVTNSDGSVIAIEERTGQELDTYKADTNYDGFYDLEYGAGGTNGQIQWTKNIHEPVPVIDKGFVPTENESWMGYWLPK